MSIEEEIGEVVHRSGWFGANIYDAEPPFIYTIGLIETLQHPELIVFGLETSQAEILLEALVTSLRKGERFSAAEIRTIRIGTDDRRVGFRPVHPTQYQFYLGFAMGYCRHICRSRDLAAVQVFWPDGRGKFPFEAGFAWEMSDLQPRLDVPKTREEIAEFEREFR
jgi:hypothetical protein